MNTSLLLTLIATASACTAAELVLPGAATYTVPAPDSRLVNISARGIIRPDVPLICGFVIDGDVPKRVLIRAAGPELLAQGVADADADPRVRIMRGQTAVAADDNFGDDPQIILVAANVGAFPYVRGSRSAAVVLTLPPGIYTAVCECAAGDPGGSVLLEVYDAGGRPAVPPPPFGSSVVYAQDQYWITIFPQK